MKYSINCVIELYKRDRKFDKEFKPKIPDREIIIKPSSENENKLDVVINTDEFVKDEIELFLRKLAYFIVVIEELPVKNYRIRSKINNETGRKDAYSEEIHVIGNANIYISGKGGKIKIQELLENKELLANTNINDDFNLIAEIFNNALKETSIISKYILLYGILEILFKGNLKEITKWIKGNTTVQGIIIPADKKRRSRPYEHTIFTNLKDKISHWAFLKLPSIEIETYLPHLQKLVRWKIICEYNL
jgi:hypothetical protein